MLEWLLTCRSYIFCIFLPLQWGDLNAYCGFVMPNMGFEVIVALIINNAFFCDVTLFGLVYGCQSCSGTWCPYLQGWNKLSLFQVCGVSELTQFLVSFLSEPVGSSGPKFPTMDKSRGFEARVNENFTLLCPAQGFPVPAFRWDSTVFWVA